MSRWYDRAMDELDEAYANGQITYEEFRREKRELDWALQEEADQAAEQARNDVYGGW